MVACCPRNVLLPVHSRRTRRAPYFTRGGHCSVLYSRHAPRLPTALQRKLVLRGCVSLSQHAKQRLRGAVLGQ